MPTFRFVARDSEGRFQRGTQEAASAGAAIAALRGRGWAILDVQPEAGTLSLGRLLELARPAAWLPIRTLDVEICLQQLAVMLRGGLTLLAAMQTVAQQCQRRRLARVWQTVVEEVQRGKSLCDALATHACFPHIVVQLVRIGEQTGTLESVLRRGAEAMERRRNLIFSLVLALWYPSLVMIAAAAVAGVMSFVVIPKIQVFLTAMGKRLPPLTQLLLDVSTWVRSNGTSLATIAAVAGIVCLACYLWPPGRLAIDRWLLRAPVVGWILRMVATALVARSLSILLQSGVTLLESLATIETLSGNRYVRSKIAAARLEVMAGGSLTRALEDRRAFLPMLPAMVAVGESAGTLDEVLGETARFQEEQFQATIRRFSAIVEPMIIIVVGGFVGFVYIAFFLALFAAAGPGR